MKKKAVLRIGIVLIVVLFVAAALWGKQYYNNRYVGSDYYAMVPLDYDMSQKPMYSMNGNEVGTGIRYDLTAYNEQGEAKPVSFTVYSPESSISRGEIQPGPGVYLWVSASKQLVITWQVSEESSIPEKALEAIKR